MKLQKILRSISLKKFYKREKEGVMWLKIPTDLSTQSQRDKFMEATMEKLEELIYKK